MSEGRNFLQVFLRPLLESNLGRLHQWLNAPHLKPFYMRESISPDEVNRKFAPRIDGKGECYCLIASIGNVPFGYIQWYLNSSVPDYGAGTIGESAGISFDYFIGDTGFLGKGLGTKMLTCTVEKLANTINLKDRIFFVGHEPNNKAAIKCSKRAGFKRQVDKNFQENGKEYHLYSIDLREFADTPAA